MARERSPLCSPLSASHSRTVLSQDAVTMRLPSGLNAALNTLSVWPVSGSPICLPVSASHSRAVSSKDAVTMRVPEPVRFDSVIGIARRFCCRRRASADAHAPSSHRFGDILQRLRPGALFKRKNRWRLAFNGPHHPGRCPLCAKSSPSLECAPGAGQVEVSDLTGVLGFRKMRAMTRQQRSHSIEFKRQVVQEYIAGETLYGLAKRHDLSRQLIRVWVEKYEAGGLDADAQAADLLHEYETKIVALERMVGRQALEPVLRW